MSPQSFHFFFLAIKPCFILDFILFFFILISFPLSIRQHISAFYIYLNTYFCTSIWKKMFKTKCLSSYYLLGSIGSLFLTWIITVASESLIFVPNPLISIFKISPRWIFSKPKLHHITRELGTTPLAPFIWKVLYHLTSSS